MLSPYRVLDLTDHRGQLAGMILASLGAEVVLVEPPGGSPARKGIGPFVGGESLTWWMLNRGKGSVEVDIDLASAEFQKLLASADVLIDSGPGGLDGEDLAARYPQLVHVTVSAFGLDGPKADWPASDLTVLAAGCQLALTGDADRAPVRTAVPQAWLHAGAEAAGGALLALAERAQSGLGQRVDISAQQAVMMAAVPASLFGPNGNDDITRLAGGLKSGPWVLRFIYPAADGFVSIMHAFGSTAGPYTERLMKLAHATGHASQELADTDWVEYGNALFSGAATTEDFARAKDAVASFTASLTKADLFAQAQSQPLLLAPVVTVAELLDSEQLDARNYWETVEDPDLGRLRCPGAFAVVAAAPLVPLGRAPRRGEHTAHILASCESRQPWVPPSPDGSPRGLPLAGVKVLDLTWVYAGPLTTRLLSDFGATVVKVESSFRPDPSRGGGPFLNGATGAEDSGGYAHFNAGKLGLNLDLRSVEAKGVFEDLVRWADIVIDSYTPGVMAAWGFDHTALRELNPQVVALSTCLMGQSGPLSNFSGFGNLAGAVTGFYELTGWADRSPAGPFLAYTDYISPRYMVAVLLAALDERRRSGEGCSIDFSQAECSIHFLGSALAEWQLEGTLLSRMGNRDRFWAPHGVYSCTGDDAWVAIACETDEQWAGLLAAAPPLAAAVAALGLGPESTAMQRVARAEELDAALATWTASFGAPEIEQLLIAAGVPAHRVQNSTACFGDPQLVHRRHYRSVPHPVHQSCVMEGPRAKLSATPGDVLRGSPMFGEHLTEVLAGLLGYDEVRIAELLIAGAFA